MTTFHGTSGQDVFYGTTGDDTFVMTADNFVTDLIYDWGFGVNDTVDYTPSAVGVSITLNDSAGWSPPTGTVSAVFPMNIYDPGTHAYMQIEHPQVVAQLSGIENATGSTFDDVLTGNSYANVLNGGAGNDTINGGAGDDTLIGGYGDDILIGGFGCDLLTGGPGHDTFVFNTRMDSPLAVFQSPDQITDFVRGEDHIDLSGLIGDTTGHVPLTFIGNGAFTGVAGQVNSVYESQYSAVVSVDLDGDKYADFQLLVSSSSPHQQIAPLHASDFIFNH